jgi:hypothetical protein
MKTQATGPSGQSGDSSAGSGDPTRDGNSTSRSTQRGTGATQSIDFNPTTASTPASTSTDRVIAELPSQPTSASAQRAATASGQASIEESLRTARKQADRAIESQTIPREYQDLVRRVFRRYDSRTPAAPSIAPGSTEPGTTNLSPDAAPAKSPPSKPALPPK